MKKTLVVLMLLVALVSSFCFAQGATEKKNSAEPYEIKWYVANALGPQPDTEKVVNYFNEKLQEKGFPAKLNLVMTDWGSFDQKMQMVISAQEKFDLCFTSNWCNNYANNVRKGAYLDVTELLEKNAPNIMKIIPSSAWNAAKIDGGLFAMLNYQIWARQSCFAMDKVVGDKYNVDYASIKKLEDLEPYCEAVVKNEPNNHYPISSDKNSPLMFLLPYHGYEELVGTNLPGVVEFSDDTVTVKNQYKLPQVKETVALFRDWYGKGYFRKDVSTLSTGQPDQRAGLTHLGFDTYKPGIEAIVKQFFNTEAAVAIPTSKGYTTTGSIIATMTAVSATSENPELVVKFYDLLFSDPELYNIICYGIEGTHYEKINANTIRLTDNKGYRPNTDWLFGNQFNAYVFEGVDPNVWKETIKINEESIPSKTLGFIFDPENVMTEIANLTSVVNQYLPIVGNGAGDAKMYDEFVAKLDAAGADKLIAEVQKQLNAWLGK